MSLYSRRQEAQLKLRALGGLRKASAGVAPGEGDVGALFSGTGDLGESSPQPAVSVGSLDFGKYGNLGPCRCGNSCRECQLLAQSLSALSDEEGNDGVTASTLETASSGPRALTQTTKQLKKNWSELVDIRVPQLQLDSAKTDEEWAANHVHREFPVDCDDGCGYGWQQQQDDQQGRLHCLFFSSELPLFPTLDQQQPHPYTV